MLARKIVPTGGDMNAVPELIHRAERLQQQVEVLRHELVQLRNDLERLVLAPASADSPKAAAVDCLTVAAALAQDLGPDFSSDDPHGLAERGDWFADP